MWGKGGSRAAIKQLIDTPSGASGVGSATGRGGRGRLVFAGDGVAIVEGFGDTTDEVDEELLEEEIEARIGLVIDVVVVVVVVLITVVTSEELIEEMGVVEIGGEVEVVLVEDVDEIGKLGGFFKSCCSIGPDSLGSVNWVVRWW